SGWAGLLGAVPLAFTIILNYMVMGFAGINLDLVTSIIASVAIGVGIDYTIHFLETFRAERARSDSMDEVLKNTFQKSGTGIVTNALAVGLGFLVLCFSEFVVLRYIGVLVAIVMFSSATLALTIIPGVLHLTDPKFMKPRGGRTEDGRIEQEEPPEGGAQS
ncbi:MAG: MMPL family transporter, partial [Treponemataceae bacterium]|nr:MMPL family transporter [Treponemataceae bacterium]